ncbi:MAG TPA: hypothetical protein PK983_11355 [Syntrophales bacterium]|nr:hypothetical protein [Syntrophales bacterium]
MKSLNLAGIVNDEEPVIEAEFEEQKEVGPVLSLAVVKPKFDDYKKEAERIAGDVKDLEVKDDESLNIAIMIGGKAKKIVKAIEVKRKEIILDPQEFVKGVNSICKAITESLDAAERTAKQKISQYQAKVELERRKQEEAARKAAADLQKKIDADAKKAGVEAPTVVAPVIPSAPKVTRAENGTASYQVKRWVCTVNNAADVPREYCEPSKRLLDEAVKMGIREIAGCKIEEVSETRFRT